MLASVPRQYHPIVEPQIEGARRMYITISDRHAERQGYQPPPSKSATLPLKGLRQGAHLFHEGDRVQRIYQVVSGVLRLTRVLEDGRRQVIAFGFPGDIVGFPCDGRHHTDCDALTPAELQPYRVSALDKGLGDAELQTGFLKAALREIAAMQDHFMMLGRKSAAERVASFLLVLADRVGTSVGQYTQVDLPMSRADIADFLGLTTETVSRYFSHLRKEQVIALDRIHTVIVLQPDVLLEIADGAKELGE